MKFTAKAHSNIALIKFWGKRNEELRLPMNDSISINLSDIFTVTSVEFDRKFKSDTVTIDDIRVGGKEKNRVIEHLDRVRKMAGISLKAEVTSRNNFPKGTGLASSASGFAALSLAGCAAAGLKLGEKNISVLARLGSGSACRSVPGGWVEWKESRTSNGSYALSLYDPDYWDIRDLVVIVGSGSKKVSSTEGHATAESSPFFRARIKGMRTKIKDLKDALRKKDFTKMGEVAEAEAVNMHAVMMTSRPPLFYWSEATIDVMKAVKEWRKEGLECYFTIDAGPNVHVICQQADVNRLKPRLVQLKQVNKVVVNSVAGGTKLVEQEKTT